MLSVYDVLSEQQRDFQAAEEWYQKSLAIKEKQGDEYVTLEAMLLALFQISSPASTILKDAGLSEKELEAAVRKAQAGGLTEKEIRETFDIIMEDRL